MKITMGVGSNTFINPINKYKLNKNIEVVEKNNGNIKYFIFTKNSKLSKKEFKHCVISMILEIIYNVYFINKIKYKIYRERNDIKNKDKMGVLNWAKEILLNKDNFFLERKDLYNKLNQYLLENDTLFIDGFLRFRMEELDLFINMIIDRGLEELTLEKEYEEFIKILQYFVESQEPKYEYINIIFKGNNHIILDEKSNVIKEDCFNDIVEEIEPNGISKEDLLIATLIVLAPENIFIHLDENNEKDDTIKIISHVFENRVQFCLGCKQCANQGKIKKRVDRNI